METTPAGSNVSIEYKKSVSLGSESEKSLLSFPCLNLKIKYLIIPSEALTAYPGSI